MVTLGPAFVTTANSGSWLQTESGIIPVFRSRHSESGVFRFSKQSWHKLMRSQPPERENKWHWTCSDLAPQSLQDSFKSSMVHGDMWLLKRRSYMTCELSSQQSSGSCTTPLSARPSRWPLIFSSVTFRSSTRSRSIFAHCSAVESLVLLISRACSICSSKTSRFSFNRLR